MTPDDPMNARGVVSVLGHRKGRVWTVTVRTATLWEIVTRGPTFDAALDQAIAELAHKEN